MDTLITKLIPTRTSGGMGRNKAVPSVSSNNVGLDPNEDNITKQDKDISTVSTLVIFTKDKAVTIKEYSTVAANAADSSDNTTFS